MPSEGRAETRRLHPSSLLFIIGSLAWSLLAPGVVALVYASRRGRPELWIMLFFIPAVVGALLKYFSYRYRLDRDELVVREGIIFRNERHIPYGRIQNIDLVQNPLHRILGVAEVRVETAGGEKPEAVMRVLSLRAVEHMREQVFAGRNERLPAVTADADVATPREPRFRALHSMDSREVVLFGLISNKGMLVVAAAMGVFWQTDLFDRWTSSLSPEALQRLRAFVRPQEPLTAALLALVVVVILLVLMRVLSVLWALIKLHGFRLQRRGDDLRTEYGIWPRVSKTIPRHRIQVLSTRQGWLHRRLSRVAVQVETAGSAGERDSAASDRLWLAPLIDSRRLDDLLRQALPNVDPAKIAWEPISPKAGGRMFRRGLLLLIPFVVAGVAFLGPWALVPGALLALASWANARLFVRHTAYAIVSGAVFFRSGWWTRRMSVARFNKIQALELTQTPFDRRHRMASLRLDTAGATRVGHGIDIPFLAQPTAATLLDRLSAEAARTAFRW